MMASVVSAYRCAIKQLVKARTSATEISSRNEESSEMRRPLIPELIRAKWRTGGSAGKDKQRGEKPPGGRKADFVFSERGNWFPLYLSETLSAPSLSLTSQCYLLLYRMSHLHGF